MAFLEENTDLSVADRGKWFYAVSGSDGPAGRNPVTFRADLDALPIPETICLPYGSLRPGVSHKCGHDGHAAALAGLALELSKKKIRDRSVYLIFQMGEEIGRGGEECSRLIDEKRIGEVYAFHNLSGYPEGTVVYRPRLTQPASEGLTIAFEGRTCHASEPEKGRNPSQAIAEMVLFLGEKLREPHQGMLLGTVVGIQSGGNDFGLSAGEGAFRVTLRAEEETEMTALETALRERAEMLGKRDGLRVHVRTEDPFSATVNDDRCLEKVKAAAAALGIPSMKMNTLWRASEDFGYYQKRCPGAIFYIGNGESYPPLHTAEYDFDDRILPHAVDLFYEIARM